MIIKNTRYYKFDGDDLDEICIISSYNDDTYLVKHTQNSEKYNNKKEKMSEDFIKNSYTKLSPDGFISFNIVKIGKDIKDVMVTIIRHKDVKLGVATPYCVCRQCINDFFASQIKKFSKEFFGISVSIDTCPTNIDFTNFLSCNNIEKNESVAYYIGDSLKYILSFIDSKEYDKVLYNLFVDRCKYKSNKIYHIQKEYMKKPYVDGFCKNLKQLLELNNFKYDLHQAFDIIPFNLDLSMCIGNSLDMVAQTKLSELLCVNIVKSLVIKYDKSIDLSKIERSYKLISDISENVYIVCYTHYGKYHVPLENVESKESIEKMNSIINSNSVKDAYNSLLFNKTKYE